MGDLLSSVEQSDTLVQDSRIVPIRSFSAGGTMFAGIVLTGSVGVLAIALAAAHFGAEMLGILWFGMLALVASAMRSARMLSELEDAANDLRGLIATYKAFRCERDKCLAGVSMLRASLFDHRLMQVVAALDCDLAETIAEIGRVSDRLVQLTTAQEASTGDQ